MIDTVLEIVTLVLAAAGVLCLVLTSLGVVRLPDAPTRLHAATKIGLLGMLFTLASVMVYSRTWMIVVKTMLLAILLVLLLPLIAHLYGQAFYSEQTNRHRK